jgi:hypothetical protein
MGQEEGVGDDQWAVIPRARGGTYLTEPVPAYRAWGRVGDATSVTDASPEA